MGDDYIYSYSQGVLKSSQKYFDSEGALVSERGFDGYVAQVITYKDKQEIQLIWNDGEYVYTLSSIMLSVDDLVEIARSVQAVPNP